MQQFLEALIWRCYIDDIFMMWEHGKEELPEFFDVFSCHQPTIKFTAEYSRVQMNLLDNTVMKNNNSTVKVIIL